MLIFDSIQIFGPNAYQNDRWDFLLVFGKFFINMILIYLRVDFKV